MPENADLPHEFCAALSRMRCATPNDVASQKVDVGFIRWIFCEAPTRSFQLRVERHCLPEELIGVPNPLGFEQKIGDTLGIPIVKYELQKPTSKGPVD